MNSESPLGWMQLLENIADQADAIALRYFQAKELSVDRKHDQSPVTEADRAIEAMARAVIAERYPTLGVFGEEEGETAGPASQRVIIDPIDGTRNFVRGIPLFATLLAVEDEGEIVAGVVSAPALASRWRAARGHGAFVGSRRMHVSEVRSLEDGQLFHGDLGGRSEANPPSGMRALLAQVERSRGFGDFYQHVLVAQGAGEIAVDPEVKPWDIAPLTVIVEEAGGRATSLAGDRTIYAGSLVTSNGLLHARALEALANDAAAGGD